VSPCLRVESSPHGLVDLRRIDPSIRVDLRYASTRNVFGVQLYRRPRCLLRRPVALRLARVQRRLRRQRVGLLVLDAYRPLSVQRRIWALKRGSRYLTPPWRVSRHSRGAAVDATLVDARGCPLPMPSRYDEFSARASRRYRGGPATARRNRWLLERAMVAEGFRPNPGEWWHFDDPHWRRYAPLDVRL
jgi:D-alanyl-D-alanine dipeptidase